MSINSVNLVNMGSYGAYSQRLSDATRMELEELGISYTKNTTEDEAKALIRQERAKRNQENKEEYSTNQNKTTQKNETMEKLMKLASKLGIEANEEMNFNELSRKVESKIEQELKMNNNNVNELQKLRGYSQELASIQAESNGTMGFDNTNQALMQSLVMLSEYNKNFLNKD